MMIKKYDLHFILIYFYLFSFLPTMKMILIIPVLCILSVGYIDADVAKKERMAQNYSAFDTISEEDLHLEKIRYEMKMKEMQVLIDNAK